MVLWDRVDFLAFHFPDGTHDQMSVISSQVVNKHGDPFSVLQVEIARVVRSAPVFSSHVTVISDGVTAELFVGNMTVSGFIEHSSVLICHNYAFRVPKRIH